MARSGLDSILNLSEPKADYIVSPSLPELAYNTIVSQAKQVEAEANAKNEALIVTLTSGGVRLQVQKVAFQGQLLIIQGFDQEGASATVVQHYSQVSILFQTAAAWCDKYPVEYQIT